MERRMAAVSLPTDARVLQLAKCVPASVYMVALGIATFCDCGVLVPRLLCGLTFLLMSLAMVVSNVPLLNGVFWTLNTFAEWVNPAPVRALEYVLQNSKQGDPQSVVDAMDDYCWGGTPRGSSGVFSRPAVMNIGDVKGKILDKAVEDAKPKVALELGAFIGYSSVRIAAKLPEDGVLHSVDPSAFSHALQAKMLAHSGLSHKVHCHFGYSGDVMGTLSKRGLKLDLLLIDHVKDLYLSDLQLAQSLGLFKKGSVVVADNVLFPGAPEYKKWILEQKAWKTEVHQTTTEYMNDVPDEVLVSVYQGE